MNVLFLFVTSLSLPLNDCTVYSLAFDQNKFISSADQSPLLFCSKSTFQTDQFIKLLNEYHEAGIFLFFRHWTVNSSCTIFGVANLPRLGYQLMNEHYRVLPFILTIFRQRETEPVWDKVHVHLEMSAVSILGTNPQRWWQPSLETAARQKRTPHDLWKWRCLCLCPNFALVVHLHFCKLHPKTFFGVAWFVRWIALTVSCNDWQVEVQPRSCPGPVQQTRR